MRYISYLMFEVDTNFTLLITQKPPNSSWNSLARRQQRQIDIGKFRVFHAQVHPFSLFTPGVFPSLPTALLAACKEHHRDDDKSSTRKKFPSSRDYHVEKCAERNQISISFYVWVFPPAYSFHRVFGAPPSPPLSPPSPESELVWCVLLPFSQYLTSWTVEKCEIERNENLKQRSSAQRELDNFFFCTFAKLSIQFFHHQSAYCAQESFLVCRRELLRKENNNNNGTQWKKFKEIFFTQIEF